MRALIIVNPAAGSTRPSLEATLRAEFEESQVYFTTAAGDATERARQAARDGVPLVVSVGGDDTVREIIRGILGTTTTLGILPGGTFNDLSASLGIPDDLDAAIQAIKQGEIRRMDLGQLDDGTIFCESLGIGFDTMAWQAMPRPERHGLMRYVAGALAGIQTLRQYSPRALSLGIDGMPRVLRAMEVIIANTPFTGARMRVAPQASLFDGALDVCIVPAISKLRWCLCIPFMFSGTYIDHFPQVEYLQGREIRISARRRLPLRVDNAVTHRLPVTVRVLPGALPVVVPRVPVQPQVSGGTAAGSTDRAACCPDSTSPSSPPAQTTS